MDKNTELIFSAVDRFGDIAKDAVNMWYNEEKKYQYKNAGFASGTGHFTQVKIQNEQILFQNIIYEL